MLYGLLLYHVKLRDVGDVKPAEISVRGFALSVRERRVP